MTPVPTAVVLFAHGSRDPLWRGPIDAVAREIAAQAPDVEVQCAFLELMAPDLPETVAALAQRGHRCIRVVPMFLGIGRHAREDLPLIMDGLRQQHPDLRLELQPAIGEQPALTRCMARIALGQDGLNTT